MPRKEPGPRSLQPCEFLLCFAWLPALVPHPAFGLMSLGLCELEPAWVSSYWLRDLILLEEICDPGAGTQSDFALLPASWGQAILSKKGRQSPLENKLWRNHSETEDKDLWASQGLRASGVGCRLALRAPSQPSGGAGVLITVVRCPCFSLVAWAWTTGCFCLLDMPESFSQFDL